LVIGLVIVKDNLNLSLSSSFNFKFNYNFVADPDSRQGWFWVDGELVSRI